MRSIERLKAGDRQLQSTQGHRRRSHAENPEVITSYRMRVLRYAPTANLVMRANALLAVALVAAALSGCGREPTRRSDAPNLVVLVVDTLRADRLPEYGHERATSGALAELLASSIRFEEAFTPAPWTRPTIASLFSGLGPSRHGSQTRRSTLLNPLVVSLAERLQEAGWRTGGFSHNVEISRQTLFDQGFDTFEDYQGGVTAYPDVSKMVRAARRWVRRADRPFFLYLQPMNVHGPYTVPAARQADLLGRRPGGEFVYGDRLMSYIMGGAVQLREQVAPEYVESLQDQYDTAIRYLFESLAALFQDLRKSGELERTLLVVTADHGEELFDHAGFSHGYTLHREIVRVPLFVKLPGESVGRVVQDRVTLLDLHPTLLELLGVPATPDLDGLSFAPLVRGEEGATTPRDAIVFEVHSPLRCIGEAILVGEYKLVRIEKDYQGRRNRRLLFRVSDDPDEHRDLAAELPEVVAELEARLDEILADWRRNTLPKPDAPEAELDEDTLRALGYL